MNHYSVYTGPTIVQQIGERLIDAGLAVTLHGTSHVYVNAESEYDILAALGRGRGWTLNDIYKLPY